MGTPLSKRKAAALLAEIRNGLLDVEGRFREFVAGRGWEPLGYETLDDLCREELGDVHLAPAVVKVIVYALIDEGRLDEDVVVSLGGRIGETAVAALRRQKDIGVAPELATTHVRSHERRMPEKPSGWNDRVDWDPDERAHAEAVLAAHGYDTQATQTTWTTRVLDREIGRLEQSGVGR